MQALSIPDLAEKIFLVTGASTGIGAAAAAALGAQKARVIVHFNESEAEAESVVTRIVEQGGTARSIRADLRVRGAAEDMVARAAELFDGIDGLINNAGSMVKRVAIADSTDAIFDEIVDLNIRAVVAASRAAIPLFKAKGGGVVINTTFIAARTGGAGGTQLFAGAKAFINNFTRGLATELAPLKVRVNAIAPGFVRTKFRQRFDLPQAEDVLAKRIPLERVGEPEDLAGAFLFLSSNLLSGYMTGQILELNGGFSMP
jgi:3-oxoacyl-[acyl-carrier protein] reductase